MNIPVTLKQLPMEQRGQIRKTLIGKHPGLRSCLSGSNLSDMNNENNAISRNVSFHSIEIREYERALGDNPSVGTGPPIALGWKYDPDHKVVDVDDYEATREPRKVDKEMILPKSVREQILKKECGVSERKILMAVDETNVIKSKRRTSLKNSAQAIERRDELLEAACRKFKRFVTGNSKKKEEERIWKNAEIYAMKKAKSLDDMKKVHPINDSLEEDIHTVVSWSSSGTSMTEPDFEPQHSADEANEETNMFTNASKQGPKESSDGEWEVGLDEEEYDVPVKW